MSALTKFFDTIRPIKDLLTYKQYCMVVDAAAELNNEACEDGRREIKGIYGIKSRTPESIVNNTPETHSMNVL